MREPEITEDDWIKPLVILREIAERRDVTFTHDQEQSICREYTKALTAGLDDAARLFGRPRTADVDQ